MQASLFRRVLSTSLVVGSAWACAACADPASGRGDYGPLEDPDGSGKADTHGGSGVPLDPGAEQAPCAAEGNVQWRIEQCAAGLQDDELRRLLGVSADRPLGADDLLYYVNRWYSIDPCFPSRPAGEVDGFQEYIDQAGTEPEMRGVCGSYENDLITLPSFWTDRVWGDGDDDDGDGDPSDADEDDVVELARLRQVAWDSPLPPGLDTLGGQALGLDGRIGFLPMFEAAWEEVNVRLMIRSGFRSADEQVVTFQGWADSEGGGEAGAAAASVYSAQPLHSEHQLGTTVDVSYRVGNGSFDAFADPDGFHASAAGQWIVHNAHRFGIVVTYEPHKVHVHQYKPEPWHLRFVGVELATLAYTCDLSTEEILAHRYEIPQPLPEFSNMQGVYDDARDDGWTPDECADYGPLHEGEGDESEDEEPEAPPSQDSSFCQGRENGPWCDGGDEVDCQGGRETTRRTCVEGCCSFPPGQADQCAEDLSDAELGSVLSCTEPA